MRRILFIANGHGENAIAARIGGEIAGLSREPLGLDLLPIVGTGGAAGTLALVGPRRRLPSGGLVAMGNVGAFARDVGAGFLGLLAAQLAFLRAARGRYDAVVVVGDAYALALGLIARTQTFFVGTAKSVHVAPYGRFERGLLRRARRVFVRDGATARLLQTQRVAAEAPGNAIVDLIDNQLAARNGTWIGLLPGSRETAYEDGVRLARVAHALAEHRPALGALFSVAPGLDAGRFARGLAADGWQLESPGSPGSETPEPLRNGGAPRAARDDAEDDVPFEAVRGRARLVGWQGDFGSLLRASVAVLGQAGTANEQAAAAGLPVIALQHADHEWDDWYRMRQRRLLGNALLLVPSQPREAAVAIEALLADPQRLAAMGAEGRARMGSAGGARTIALAVLACLH